MSPEKLPNRDKLESESLGDVALNSFLKNPIDPQEALRKAEDFLRRHKRNLVLFAGDKSLNYQITNDDTFSYDAAGHIINFPLGWMMSGEYTEDELEFACLHELSHFIDMRRNPDAYIGNFEAMREEGMRLGREYIEEHPDCGHEEGELGNFFSRELHMLYNCLDDIYVNNVAMNKTPHYRRYDGRKSIVTMYEKTGYKEGDLTDMPLHSQLAFALLRDEMVGNELGKTVVDPAVEKILSEKINGMDMRTRVATEIKPVRQELIDPEKRYNTIRSYIQPQFVELMKQAIKKQEELPPTPPLPPLPMPPKGPEGESGPEGELGPEGEPGPEGELGPEGEPGPEGSEGEQEGPEGDSGSEGEPGKDKGSKGDPFDPFKKLRESQNPEHNKLGSWGNLDEESVKEAVDNIRKKEELDKEAERILKEKEEDYRDDIDAFDEKYGIAPYERETATALLEEVNPQLEEMKAFWKRLVGKSIEYKLKTVIKQRKGRPNVESIIDNYTDYVNAERSGDYSGAEIYERKQLVHEDVCKPERIEVSLIVDCSGSMDGDRIETAAKSLALLLYSIRDFNQEILNSRNITKSNLQADTEVITFTSSCSHIKDFNHGSGSSNEEADIIKCLSRLYAFGGTTAQPLKLINQSLSQGQIQDIKDGKLKKIVFEITDGGVAYPDEAAVLSQYLADTGIILVGFQIGICDSDERESFNTSWGEGLGYDNLKGIYIGNNVAKLPEMLMRELAASLGDIMV